MKRTVSSPDLRSLDREINSFLPSSPPVLRRLKADLRQARGKKQRGRLMLILGRAFSSPPRKLIKAAGAVEVIHLATLIHDDVLDGSNLRRRQETLYRAHGAVPALLYGDLLFARSMRAVNSLGNPALTDRLLETAYSICSGEILEVQNRLKFPWKERTYFRIISRKTAALFQYSCLAPAVLSGFSEERLRVLGRFGLNLGLAYQIVDDCLDFMPASSSTGKDRLADLKNGVPNLALIISGREKTLRAAIRKALKSGAGLRDLKRAGLLIHQNGSIGKAALRASLYLRKANRDADLIRSWSGVKEDGRLTGYLKEMARTVEKLSEK